MTSGLPLNQLAGALSLATDLAVGIANEGALRTCVAATLLGRACGLRGPELLDVYYVALFRYLGCSGYAHEEAYVAAGDDQQMLSALELTDAGRPSTVLSAAFTRLAKDAGFGARMKSIARLLSDPHGYAALAKAHCEQAVALARMLGMRASIVASLGELYERWDGRGEPDHKRAEATSLAARITHVAVLVEIFLRSGGAAAVVVELRRRSAGQLDPNLVDVFLRHAPELLAHLSAPSVWPLFVELEPEPRVLLAPDRLLDVAHAFGCYADIKSPYSIGHSTQVARLTDAIAVRAQLPDETRHALQVASRLHDLGVVSVPNGILDKRGPLLEHERERVRQHAYQTERILAQSPLLAPFAALAASHHERLDASGYPRAQPASAIALAGRILAACDVAQALSEERAHRPALEPDALSASLREEVKAGRLDREVVGWVLEHLGLQTGSLQRGGPDGLSEREVEVLCHLARGRSNKEIGQRLFISPRTVQQHIRHIYEKTRVSTRAAAALYATEHDLVGRFAE